jgi:hypothetical protein
MAPAFEMDESNFPVIFTAFRGPVQIAAWDTFYGRLDRLCTERRRFSTIVDISQGAVPSASERKHIAQGLASRHLAFERYCAGSAVVITKPLIRGAMTAVLWIQPVSYPYQIVATIDAARSLCAGWLCDPLARSPTARGARERP